MNERSISRLTIQKCLVKLTNYGKLYGIPIRLSGLLQTQRLSYFINIRYDVTPVTKKYLCVIIKVFAEDLFIITTYFTDTVKRGEILWKKK